MLSLLSFKSALGERKHLLARIVMYVPSFYTHGEHECCSDIQVLLLLNMSRSFPNPPEADDEATYG
jgi:hypothetical protein